MARNTRIRRSALGSVLFIAPFGTALPTPLTMVDSAWEGDGWICVPNCDPKYTGDPVFEDVQGAQELAASDSDLVGLGKPQVAFTISESDLYSQAIGLLAGTLVTGGDGTSGYYQEVDGSEYAMISMALLTLSADPTGQQLVPTVKYFPYAKRITDNDPKYAQNKNKTLDFVIRAFVAPDNTYIPVGTFVMKMCGATDPVGDLIPDVVTLAVSPYAGLTGAEAVSVLNAVGFSTISQVATFTDAVTSGIVFDQSPVVGLSRIFTTAIVLKVSKGPDS
jgi:hypothetical protein